MPTLRLALVAAVALLTLTACQEETTQDPALDSAATPSADGGPASDSMAPATTAPPDTTTATSPAASPSSSGSSGTSTSGTSTSGTSTSGTSTSGTSTSGTSTSGTGGSGAGGSAAARIDTSGPGPATIPASAYTTTQSGLQYYDLREGSGASPEGSDRVRVHYTGWLESNGEKFDSSYDRGEPITFPLDGVIAGWTEGLQSMQVGGKRQLVIPSDLGYGQRGTPDGTIPPGATLVFEVELLDIPSR